MGQSHSNLPDDVEALRAIIAAQALQLAKRDSLIDKLKAQLAVLKRARFGTSSEKIERSIEQLEMALEDIEAAESEIAAPAASHDGLHAKSKPSRHSHCPIICRVMMSCIRQPAPARSVAAPTSSGKARP